MPLRTPICDLFEIEYPILLAGMATAAGPILAAAVSNAGGLGVLGAAGLTPAELDEQIRELRSLTSKPFGVDTLLPSKVPAEAERSQVQAAIPQAYIDVLNQTRKHYDLPQAEATGPTFSQSFFDEQLQAVMDNNVPVYVAGLGNPARYVEDLHKRGTKVVGIVGNVRNAGRVAAGGVDAIVAQGHDAGGHNSPIGTMALIPQAVDIVAGRMPLIAAGGIGDGRGIVAALALGAQGVWLGTRFLVSHEARVPDGQKEKVIEAAAEDAQVTRYFTGKPARILHSPILDGFAENGLPPLPMPSQGMLSGPLMRGAAEAGRWDLNPGPAGQIAGMLTRRQSAAEIMAELVEQVDEVLAELRTT